MRAALFTYVPLPSVLGQIDPVTPSKDFPGADLLGNLLQCGMYLSLALSVGSIIYGAGSWTWSCWGNSGYAVSGKNWVLGGIVGALLLGARGDDREPSLHCGRGVAHASHLDHRRLHCRPRRNDNDLASRLLGQRSIGRASDDLGRKPNDRAVHRALWRVADSLSFVSVLAETRRLTDTDANMLGIGHVELPGDPPGYSAPAH